jgi:isocitrate lyase
LRDSVPKNFGGTSATMPFVNALGALTGNQAMQQVRAGLKAIYLSGWQVAGDANIAGEMYPDQSLYPVELRAAGHASASTTHCCAPTNSQSCRRRSRDRLAAADRRRRRGRRSAAC